MRLFTPTQSKRLNEATGFLFLGGGILVLLAFASFHPLDPSWNTVAGSVPTENLIGPVGAYLADLFLQAFGLAAFLFPLLMFGLGWKWIRSEALAAPIVKLIGSVALVCSACGAAGLLPDWRMFDHTILAGGALGFVVSGILRRALNLSGAAVVLATALIVSTYLVSTFTLSALERWFAPFIASFNGIRDKWRRWIENRREAALQKQQDQREAAEARAAALAEARQRIQSAPVAEEFIPPIVPEPIPTQRTRGRKPEVFTETLPWDDPPVPVPDAETAVPVENGEIPICRLDELPVPETSNVLEFPFTKPAKSRDTPPLYGPARLHEPSLC